MSEENVEIWRSNLEAQLAELTAGTSPEATISKLAEIWDPDMELDATEVPVMDLNRVYRGPDEARQFWHEWFAAWETLRYEYELIDAGERVVMLLDLHHARALDGHRDALWERSSCFGRRMKVKSTLDALPRLCESSGGRR